jgi:hypothetical protein
VFLSFFLLVYKAPHIKKENTAIVIPNAIRVFMVNKDEHFFGSFSSWNVF